MKYFIVSFACFIVVLGTVSLLMFMKSLNFDLKNLISASDETTTDLTETSTSSTVEMSGKSTVAFICSNTNSDLSFVYYIVTDMSEKIMKIVYLSPDNVVEYAGVSSTLNEFYRKSGVNGFLKASQAFTSVTVDRYICVNETQFKSFASKTGDVVVNIPEAISSKQSGGMSLNAGEQSLSADLLLRYIVYAQDHEKTDAFAAFMNKAFSKTNIIAMDKLFSFVANNSATDISIVDYTNEKEKIASFVNSGGTISAVYDLESVVG